MILELLNSETPDKRFDECASLHQAVITGGFLTKLGPKFLTEFYRAVATLPESFVIVAHNDNDQMAGLIAGSVNSRKLIRQVFLKRAIFLLPHMVSVVLKPSFIRKIAEVILYPSKQDFKGLPDAEILNFAISPKLQGKGTGRLLFAALCDEMKNRGVEKMRIVTGASQQSAQRFYATAGAEQVSNVSVHGKDESIVFLYDLC